VACPHTSISCERLLPVRTPVPQRAIIIYVCSACIRSHPLEGRWENRPSWRPALARRCRAAYRVLIVGVTKHSD